ncbi:MAG: VCBS repeat-containing protein [Bacteroidales bacterium]|nr:VCBS repeat-containing protein [Candidatus Latescibacterota bacterium]
MNRYVIVFAVIVFVSLAVSSRAEQPLVAAPVNYDTGVFPEGICVADLDGDGDVDIVVPSTTGDLVSIFMNNGDGTFAARVDVSVLSDPCNVFAHDIDLDGDNDLLILHDDDDLVEVQLNDGNGNFVFEATYAVGTNPRSAAVADYNGDGSPDIVTANFYSDDVSVLLNDGSGAFSSAVTYGTGDGANQICAADFDNDGDIDLAFPVYMSAEVGVLMNNGDGTMAAVVDYNIGATSLCICTADFNKDGYTDVAVGNSGGNNVLVLLNDRDGTFSAAVGYPGGSGPTMISAADLDGDGYPDLVTSHKYEDEMKILLNDGDGTFGGAVHFDTGVNPRNLILPDLNGDGAPDLALVTYVSRHVSVYLNLTLPDIYSVRDIPGDQGGQVFLSWTGARADINMTGDITHYSIWRTIDQVAAISAIEQGAESADRVPELVPGADKVLIRTELTSTSTYFWELVETVDAYFREGYGRPVSTFFDSTAACTDFHYFQVIAHTAIPSLFWASLPDSGYSVDNLDPSFPLDLQGTPSQDPEGLVITWKPNRDPDFDHYAIFRGLSSGFETGDVNMVASIPDTIYFDDEWSGDSGYYYKLRAVDTHGNESLISMLSPEDVTGVEPEGIPAATFLGQNYPNPFNPSTTISYGLSKPENINIKIYDTAGRLIRVLIDEEKEAGIHETLWDGRNNEGVRVASGIYFYRMTAGINVETKKMVLLK